MPDETAPEPSPEPSMDEILASIRRIISDDGAAPAQGVAPAEEKPLLLTERVDPLPPEAPEPMTDHAAEPEHAPPEPAPQAAPEDAWIGKDAADKTSSAFDRLSLMNSPPPAPTPAMAMPPPGRTLEDVTRDMIQPIIKAWLDENLPRIVQDRVDEEVERLARRRVR